MEFNAEKELAYLRQLETGQLREKYLEVCGETTKVRNRDYLYRRILWRMQANLYGGLSEKALARARELVNTADLRLTMPGRGGRKSPESTPMTSTADKRVPMPGTIITRDYKGEKLKVKVLVEGFEYLGEKFLSLTAVAKAITGSHCNGFHFFKLQGGGK